VHSRSHAYSPDPIPLEVSQQQVHHLSVRVKYLDGASMCPPFEVFLVFLVDEGSARDGMKLFRHG